MSRSELTRPDCNNPPAADSQLLAIRHRLPDAERLRLVQSVFKMLTDPLRVRILLALAISDVCVCNLVEILDTPQALVSQQLKKLKDAGLIMGRREKQRMYYSLCRDKCPGLLPMLEQMTA